MGKLLKLDAPDVIIANESRIFLTRHHGGAWKAIWSWVGHEIRRHTENIGFDCQVLWYRAMHNLTRDQAIDVIIGPLEHDPVESMEEMDEEKELSSGQATH